MKKCTGVLDFVRDNGDNFTASSSRLVRLVTLLMSAVSEMESRLVVVSLLFFVWLVYAS